MTNHELIILALEQLRDSSYSPERREQCQRVIEEMKMGNWIRCSDKVPRKEDEDCNGQIWTAYHDPITRVKTEPQLKSPTVFMIFATKTPEAHYWMPTGLEYPEPPID